MSQKKFPLLVIETKGIVKDFYQHFLIMNASWTYMQMDIETFERQRQFNLLNFLLFIIIICVSVLLGHNPLSLKACPLYKDSDSLKKESITSFTYY